MSIRALANEYAANKHYDNAQALMSVCKFSNPAHDKGELADLLERRGDIEVTATTMPRVYHVLVMLCPCEREPELKDDTEYLKHIFACYFGGEMAMIN